MNFDKINYPTPKKEYKVLVRCFTYNQSRYIEDALNGFAMQQTNFPYVCLVVDDASTDGEQEVIKAWMDRECDMSRSETIDIPTSIVIIVPHKSNASCTFAFYLLKQNLYKATEKKMRHVTPWREKCEYEAMCEGDDYWIDKDKLQLQFDYMQKHPNCSMSFHGVKYVYPNMNIALTRRYGQSVHNCNIKDMILSGGNYAKINSMMIDIKKYGRGYIEWCKSCPVGDLPMMLTLFVKGNVAYIDKVMSCYRISAIGSWSSGMSNDILKQTKHTSEIKQMWITFDDYTRRKYHWTIRKKILNNDLYLLKTKILLTIKSILG